MINLLENPNSPSDLLGTSNIEGILQVFLKTKQKGGYVSNIYTWVSESVMMDTKFSEKNFIICDKKYNIYW